MLRGIDRQSGSVGSIGRQMCDAPFFLFWRARGVESCKTRGVVFKNRGKNF